MTDDEIWKTLVVGLLGKPIDLSPTTSFTTLGFSKQAWQVFIADDVATRFGVFVNSSGITTVGELAAAISNALSAGGGGKPPGGKGKGGKKPKPKPKPGSGSKSSKATASAKSAKPTGGKKPKPGK